MKYSPLNLEEYFIKNKSSIYSEIMKNTIIILSIAFLGIFNESFSQAVVDGFLKGSNVQLKYYKPFKDFANHEIISNCSINSKNYFNINMDISQPSFTKLFFGEKVVWLLVEPTDSVHISIDNSKLWFDISGNNARGHEYYNLHFNLNALSKFEGVRLIFEKYNTENVNFILNSLKEELNKQTKWVDSLYDANLVTKNYKEYMEVDIESTLAWEIGNLCDKYYGASLVRDSINKSHLIKAGLFELVNPLDKRLYSCMIGRAYYDTYFDELYKTQKNKIDTSKALFGELACFELAPYKIKEYSLGRLFFDYMNYDPGHYDLCEKFEKYKQMYPKSNEYIKHLDSIDMCANRNKKFNYEIIDDDNLDLFGLLQSKFTKKKLYVDLWATWCAPCKAEFMFYNKEFYDYMKQNKIEIVFISIDENNRKDIWKKIISKLPLEGYHVFANERLKASLKEIIFNNDVMSIPRYILVNEKGKILTDNAKRPSDMLLRDQIKILCK